MSRTRMATGLAAGLLFPALPLAGAQEFPLLDGILTESRTLTVANELDEEIKVCLYRPADLAAFVAKDCFRVPADNTDEFERGEIGPFGVRVFLPGLLDKEIAANKFGDLIPTSADFTELTVWRNDGDYKYGFDIAPIDERLGSVKGPHVEEVWQASRFFNAFSGFYNTAPNKGIAVVNSADEKRKICFYNDDDDVMLVGAACRSLEADGETIWDPGDRTAFGVRTMDPRIFDKLLEKKQHLTQVSKITIEQDGEIAIEGREPPQELIDFGITETSDYRYWHQVHSTKQTIVVARTDHTLFVALKGTDDKVKEHRRLNIAGAVPVAMRLPSTILPQVGPLFDAMICDPLRESCVHRGWWGASRYVTTDVARAIREMRGDRHVILMGHSMGGTVAAYAAIRMLNAGVVDFPMTLVLFGTPRNGNAAMLDAISQARRDLDFKVFSLETRGDWAAPSWPYGIRFGSPMNLDIAETGRRKADFKNGYHGFGVYNEILTARHTAHAAGEGAAGSRKPSGSRRVLVNGDRIWWLASDYGFGDRRAFVDKFEALNPGVDADRVFAGAGYVFPPGT